MVDKPGTGGPGTAGDTDRSVGELVSDVTGNFSRLVRLELELAKAEAKVEAAKAGKGIAGFAVFAVLVHIFVILLSVTIAFVLYEVAGLPGWASFAIVTGAYLLVALLFALYGVISFRRMRGLERTQESASRLGAILRREIVPPGSRVATADQAGSAVDGR